MVRGVTHEAVLKQCSSTGTCSKQPVLGNGRWSLSSAQGISHIANML